MNNDQIQKFITACKNAGFEVDNLPFTEEHSTTINFGSNGYVRIRTMWDGELEVEYGLYAYEENSTSEWKEVIATYLMEAIKKKFQVVTIGTVSDGFWAATVPFGHICKAEEFADAIFEAFCEVYQ